MIKVAILAELIDINSFDPFNGNRKEDIAEERVYVYMKDDITKGFISLARSGLLGRPYIQYLAVSPDCRRSGIASDLLTHVESMFENERLFISTESNNEPMQALLVKRGYISAGKISGANTNGTNELYYYREKIPNNLSK